MPNHEYFRELCALAAIGQLSSGEDRELSQHLCECETCSQANAEYAHVVQHQLPQADPIRWRFRDLLPKSAPDADLRDRFLALARVEGVEFTSDVEQSSHVPSRGRLSVGWGRRARFAVATVAVVALAGLIILRSQGPKRATEGSRENQTRLSRENEGLRSQLGSVQAQVEKDATELATLKRDRTFSQQETHGLEGQLAEAREQSDSLARRVQELETREAELQNENRQKDLVAAELKAKNEGLHRDNVDNLTSRVLLESQVRDLTESMTQQTASFEQERQLMAASKDVRQLMGARNLHIMDVHDTDGAGKAAKAFGRVFYAEGQSLVFYAFDLSSGRMTPAKYTFQAWGENESVSHSLRNLGTFSVDDHEQRRWVLKVSDPKLLHGIDSVFVTAESVTDVREPHGKKLLYAYIVGQANHP